MTTWLIFPDQVSAAAAVARIDANKGFPVSPTAVTTTWDEPRPLAGGRYAIAKCRDADLAGVECYETTEAPEWAHG